jgi:PEP-CTERM motif
VTKRVVLAMAVVLAFASFAMADTLNGSVGASWQAGGWTANELGTQFFSNPSNDGPLKNAGYCMTGTGNCTMLDPAPGALQFWAHSPTVADPFVTFTPSGVGNTVTLEVEIAGFANVNEFGYADSLGSHILFTGPQSKGATATFTAVGDYAFFIINGIGQEFSTNNACGTGVTDCGNTHFAIFSPSPNGAFSDYWLAAEDLPYASSDKDFNDMIVHVTEIPEPGTLAMFGSGLIGIAAALRRKLFA